MFNYSNHTNGEAVTATVGTTVCELIPEFLYYSVMPFTHFVAVDALRNATVKESVTTESMKAESDATNVYFRNLNNKSARQRFQGNDRSHRASTRKGTYTNYLLRGQRTNADRRAAFTAALEATND